jgi:periplasmic divalent cation tolerance protein
VQGIGKRGDTVKMADMIAEYLIVLITASTEEEAARIGHTVVGERLAACVNIIRPLRSIYRWQGRIEDEQEVLLLVKTRGDLFERLKNRVSVLHSYAVPEIIALPLAAGNGPYLNWLKQETGP